jgi:hypothetical protein
VLPADTGESLASLLRFRHFREDFCQKAGGLRDRFDKLLTSASSRRDELLEAKQSATELERLFYVLEMDLPRPPQLVKAPASEADKKTTISPVPSTLANHTPLKPRRSGGSLNQLFDHFLPF